MSVESHDYGCELISVVVLGALSALSQFWFILIALGVILAVYEGSFLASRMFRAHDSSRRPVPAPVPAIDRQEPHAKLRVF